MAKLVDMKRTEADKKAEQERYTGESLVTSEDYDWGLTIRLNNEMMDKLGVDAKALGTDGKVRVLAVGVITEETSNTFNGKTRRSMSIQLQQLAVEPEGEEEDPAKVLYNAD